MPTPASDSVEIPGNVFPESSASMDDVLAWQR